MRTTGKPTTQDAKIDFGLVGAKETTTENVLPRLEKESTGKMVEINYNILKNNLYGRLDSGKKKYLFCYDIKNDKLLNIKEIEDFYFQVGVDKLKLKKEGNRESAYFRNLFKNEKLQIIELGNEEKISDIKGSWIKVRTEKGDIGWCFDGYLNAIN